MGWLPGSKALIASVEAQKYLPGTLLMCSREAGWSSLLLRKYANEPEIKEFEAPPASDQLIVLLTKGGGTIERFSRGKWQSARKMPGSLSLNAPGEQARVRWHGKCALEGLHLHIPAATMRAAAEDLRDRERGRKAFPHNLLSHDPVIAATMLSLEQGAV